MKRFYAAQLALASNDLDAFILLVAKHLKASAALLRPPVLLTTKLGSARAAGAIVVSWRPRIVQECDCVLESGYEASLVSQFVVF